MTISADIQSINHSFINHEAEVDIGSIGMGEGK